MHFNTVKASVYSGLELLMCGKEEDGDIFVYFFHITSGVRTNIANDGTSFFFDLNPGSSNFQVLLCEYNEVSSTFPF